MTLEEFGEPMTNQLSTRQIVLDEAEKLTAGQDLRALIATLAFNGEADGAQWDEDLTAAWTVVQRAVDRGWQWVVKPL